MGCYDRYYTPTPNNFMSHYWRQALKGHYLTTVYYLVPYVPISYLNEALVYVLNHLYLPEVEQFITRLLHYGASASVGWNTLLRQKIVGNDLIGFKSLMNKEPQDDIRMLFYEYDIEIDPTLLTSAFKQYVLDGKDDIIYYMLSCQFAWTIQDAWFYALGKYNWVMVDKLIETADASRESFSLIEVYYLVCQCISAHRLRLTDSTHALTSLNSSCVKKLQRYLKMIKIERSDLKVQFEEVMKNTYKTVITSRDDTEIADVLFNYLFLN